MTFQPYVDPEDDLCQMMTLSSSLGWWQCTELPLEGERFCEPHLHQVLAEEDAENHHKDVWND